jgi:hypothetical protein
MLTAYLSGYAALLALSGAAVLTIIGLLVLLAVAGVALRRDHRRQSAP